MGECRSKPTINEEHIIEQSIQINQDKTPSLRQSRKNKKDEPSPDFAAPTHQLPKLTSQVLVRLSQLGPFKYQKCGQYNRGTELGPYLLKNGAVYVGQWINGEMNGRGKFYLPDKSLFEGISIHNQIEGYGRIIHANGDYFQGEVKGSKANGEGAYVEGEITYKGTFKENLQHGEGIEFSNLYEFRGQYKHGQKSRGTLILKNKERYEYQGQFSNNKFHGRGVLINEVGKYQGQFMNGQKHGEGKFIWADGSYYQGGYMNDQKHGQGKIFNKKGVLVRECNWEHNNMIK